MKKVKEVIPGTGKIHSLLDIVEWADKHGGNIKHYPISKETHIESQNVKIIMGWKGNNEFIHLKSLSYI